MKKIISLLFTILFSFSFSSIFASETGSSQKKGDVREITCKECNGTGLIYSRHNYCLPGTTTWHSNKTTRYCDACRKSHCTECNRHDNCKKCEGTGKLIQKYNGYKWIEKGDYFFDKL